MLDGVGGLEVPEGRLGPLKPEVHEPPGGVAHAHEQAAGWAAVLEPGVLGAVDLDELAEAVGAGTGWRGVGTRSVESATARRPSPTSPAERAGLRSGDVLVQIDGKPLADLSLEAQAFLLRGAPGSSLTVEVRGTDGGARRATMLRAPIR